MLALGAYNHLLPIELRRRAVVGQFGVARFVEGMAALKIERTPEKLSEDLRRLVADE